VETCVARVNVTSKQVQQSLYSPGQALRSPGVEVPRISRQSKHESAEAVRTGCFYPTPRDTSGTHTC